LVDLAVHVIDRWIPFPIDKEAELAIHVVDWWWISSLINKETEPAVRVVDWWILAVRVIDGYIFF
jgi:hypothetical protein